MNALKIYCREGKCIILSKMHPKRTSIASIHLNKIDHQKALHFLMMNGSLPSSKMLEGLDSAKNLLKKLDYLPLALSLAKSYMPNEVISMERFDEIFDDQWEDFLDYEPTIEDLPSFENEEDQSIASPLKKSNEKSLARSFLAATKSLTDRDLCLFCTLCFLPEEIHHKEILVLLNIKEKNLHHISQRYLLKTNHDGETLISPLTRRIVYSFMKTPSFLKRIDQEHFFLNVQQCLKHQAEKILESDIDLSSFDQINNIIQHWKTLIEHSPKSTKILDKNSLFLRTKRREIADRLLLKTQTEDQKNEILKKYFEIDFQKIAYFKSLNFFSDFKNPSEELRALILIKKIIDKNFNFFEFFSTDLRCEFSCFDDYYDYLCLIFDLAENESLPIYLQVAKELTDAPLFIRLLAAQQDKPKEYIEFSNCISTKEGV